MTTVLFRKGLVLAIIGLFVGAGIVPSISSNVSSLNAGNTLYVGGSGAGNYTTIQSAIDDANSDDTVYVYNGVYYENVNIGKSIDLIGENKHTTIIDGAGDYQIKIVNTNGASVFALTLHNNTKTYPADNFGIQLFSSNNCTINNNIIKNNEWGMTIHDSTHNNILNNEIFNNDQNGIILGWHSDSNTLRNNEIYSINGYGIYLGLGKNNNISHNILDDTYEGIALGESEYNSIYDNTIRNSNVRGIRLHDSSHNTINKCSVYNNNDGVLLYLAYDNEVLESSIYSNDCCGIILDYSDSNDIIDNSIYDNDVYGIELGYDTSANQIENNNIYNNNYGIYQLTSLLLKNVNLMANNIIIHNKFYDNNHNAFDGLTNTYDNGYPSGGNYWDDYTSTDEDGDGIGDTPYNIPGGSNQDRYPLGLFYPIADAGGPYTSNVDVEVSFSASGSYDPDGSITSYQWDWTNDGTWDSGWQSSPSIDHVYETAGSYTANLMVKDNDDKTSTDTSTVTIIDESQSPFVIISEPYESEEVNSTIIIKGNASDSNGNETLQSVEIRINNGSWEVANGTTSWSYSWNTSTVEDGSHSIYARSYDGEYYSSVDVVNVTVNNSLTIFGYCPIDLHVVNPFGGVVNKSISEIPGAFYEEKDLNGDGDVDDKIFIPSPCLGDYHVFVIAEDDASVDDTYSLFVKYQGVVYCLEDNESVLDAPIIPYVFNTMIPLGNQIIIQSINGGFRVSAVIKNNGTTTATDVPWSIDLEGGLILAGEHTGGVIDELAPGASKTIRQTTLYGIGNTVITVTAGDATKQATGFILGPLVLGVEEIP